MENKSTRSRYPLIPNIIGILLWRHNEKHVFLFRYGWWENHEKTIATFLEWSTPSHFSWHIFWHSIYLASYLASILTFSLRNSIWHSISHSSWHSMWHLALAIDIPQCPLRSGSRSWGPAVPAEIWRSQLGSGSAHWDLELAVQVRFLRCGTRS